MERILLILGFLEDDDVDWLVKAGHRREIARREVLIREQEHHSAIYIILLGQFVVSISHPPSGELAHLTSGEVIGEMSFLDHLPPSATVIASEPSVVLEINTGTLGQKLSQDKDFASRWFRALAVMLSIRLRETVRNLTAETGESTLLERMQLSSDMADSMKLGSIRFDWLMRRLRNADNDTWEPEVGTSGG